MVNPFLTPQNERSFSAVIDAVVFETGRTANFLSVLGYANSTLRECQAMGLFAKDRVESIVYADAVPFTYTRPPYFRSLGAVKYGCGVYPKLKLPGQAQQNETWFFYAADDYYVFSGASLGEQVKLLSYFWFKPLMYYARLGVDSAGIQAGPYSTRLAYFDLSTDTWKYLVEGAYIGTTGNVDTDQAYRKASSNWMLDEWRDLITNGTKAKVFAAFGDTDRAQRAFALYKQEQAQFRLAIGLEAEAGAM